MLGVKFKGCCVLIAVMSAHAECQRNPTLPLSKDSFRQIQRAFMPAPRGRRTELSDIRIEYYRDSVRNRTSYRVQNITSLLADTTFDLQKRTVVYIHGYVETSTDNSVATVVKAYLSNAGYNILVLDWSNLAYGDYVSVLLNINSVGREAGKAILNLLKQGLDIKGLHLVGHSMGAHVAAVMSRFLKTRGYTVPRELLDIDGLRLKPVNVHAVDLCPAVDVYRLIKKITALDAAFPGFYPAIHTSPVNTKDAQFVDAIHTDAGWYGAATSIGHADFWPNDGEAKQPGCLPYTLPFTAENFCNHWRSWRYWAESVDGGNFLARRCDDYDAFLRGQCYETAYMGLAATPRLRGNFYLRTASHEPFALGERGAN